MQLQGISTKFSLSPEPSSSDNRDAPGMDPQRGNHEATVDNGEREEQKQKLAKLHTMVSVFYPYSMLKPTEASGFKKPNFGLTVVRPLPLTYSRWFPGETVGPGLFRKRSP